MACNWDDSALMTRWERLSDEDVARIGGDRGRLLACLVDLYGWTPAEAETEVAGWEQEPETAAACAEDAVPVGGDAVVQASADSFPASDPPGWIKQAPRAPRHAKAPPRGGAETPPPAQTAPTRGR